MARSKRFEARITFCIPHELGEKLDAAADRSMSSVSDFCRRAIVEKLQRDGAIPPVTDGRAE